MTIMTVDELSELECALIDACDEWVGLGGMIVPLDLRTTHSGCCCPFGALVRQQAGANYPIAEDTARELGLRFWFVYAFMTEFDAPSPRRRSPAAAMARRFRERYLGAA